MAFVEFVMFLFAALCFIDISILMFAKREWASFPIWAHVVPGGIFYFVMHEKRER